MKIIEEGNANKDHTTMKCECNNCESLLRVSADDLMIKFLHTINFTNPHIFEYTYICPVCDCINTLRPADMPREMLDIARSGDKEQIAIATEAVSNLYDAYYDKSKTKTPEEEAKYDAIIARERERYQGVLYQNDQARFNTQQGRKLH